MQQRNNPFSFGGLDKVNFNDKLRSAGTSMGVMRNANKGYSSSMGFAKR